MQVSNFLCQLVFVLTTLIAHTIGDNVVIEAEKLVDWIGCNSSTTLPSDIRDAWDSAMDIAYVSSGKIEWGFHPSIDFLAGPTRNQDHQSIIKAVLNNAYTFRRRYWWNPPNWTAWKTSMRCDDFHKTCAKYPTAAAYTVNPGKRTDGKTEVTKDTIVICPKVFNSKKTCAQAIKDSGGSGASNLNNFQCRGYVILHELFHLDSLSRVSTGGHIEDLGVRYQSGFDPVIRKYQAYGPVRTRVLALWPKDDVGQFIVTNADNLAQYSLSAWAAAKNRLFPNLPAADGVPDTTYNPSFFNETDAADDPTFDGYIEDNTDDPGFDETTNIGPDILLQLDPEQYLDCNNNGNIEWATAPSVSQDFAESSVATFCNNVNNQNIDTFSVPNTADTILFLGAILQIDDPTCTSLVVTPSDCVSQLGKIITGCDTDSSSTKFGGVSATECISWVAVVNGTRAARQESDAPFSCSLLVADDSLNCACTDGQLYPLLNETCGYTSSSLPSSNSTNSGQQIAVASYINPSGDPAAWNRLIGYPASKISILIANVANGPDSTVDTNWADVITRGAASGKVVLGYVRTGYLGVSSQQFTTRLGSGNLADWTAQIEQDVNMWYTLYPNLGGIFFDEGWPECGSSNQYVDLYKYINDYTKRAHPGALTVLNPGSPMASCFEDTMDTLLTFELNYTSYINSYTANDWVPKDPRKLWHIIYDVPASEVSNVAQLAAQRGAGFVQITDDVLPNPYDTLPSDSYMQSQMGAVAGGVPLNNDASAWASGSTSSGAVGSLSLVASDYSSASLSWTAATDALGYYIYLAGTNLVASVPSSMTSITIGGLTPSTTSELHVVPVGYGGKTGSSSNTVTVLTKTLPGGLTITNYTTSPSAGSVTYQANVLVPYAFVHLYLWDSIECDFDNNPGWPINFVIDDYVCTHYMVEDETLYKYTGTVPSGSTAAPWAWTEIGPITRTVIGYTYTWTLPLGSLPSDTSKFVVQAQGYNPYTTVFEPDPTHYDCKGSTLCTTPGLLAWCDHAVNDLGRNDSLSYATSNSSQTGNCWGDGVQGCGVFIQGTNCAVSGNDMWWDYQNIRKVGGCQKCGSYHRDDGCLITINYVSGCNVGQGGSLF